MKYTPQANLIQRAKSLAQILIYLVVFSPNIFAENLPSGSIFRVEAQEGIIFAATNSNSTKVFSLPKGVFINVSHDEPQKQSWVNTIFGNMQSAAVIDVSNEFQSFEYDEMNGSCDFSVQKSQISCKDQTRSSIRSFKYLPNTPIILGLNECASQLFKLRIVNKLYRPEAPPGPYYLHFFFVVSKKDSILRQINIQILPWECTP